MRVAFTSCMATQVISKQPVWDQIAAQNPDYLVLLGDSIYLDINTALHPQDMNDNEFSQHLFKLYNDILQQPQFAKLVKALPAGRVFSIWDDHDFLWNDALGAVFSGMVAHKEKVRLSTSFQEAFRATLAARLADGSFPARLGDDAFWKPKKALSTPSVDLPGNVRLHLCDVRTFRTDIFPTPVADRTILGAAQKKQIEAAVRAAPEAVHLLASGSIIADWKHYPNDLDWLLALASEHRIMVLSGDVHYNDVDAYYSGGLPLHEATSSGAAVLDTVVLGEEQQNYGLLDIDDKSVTLRLFHFGAEEKKYARKYDRMVWLPV